MLTPDKNLAVEFKDLIAGVGKQQYNRTIAQLGIKQSTSIPIFTEATAQAIRLTEAPISILSLVCDFGCQIGAIAGIELLYKLSADPQLLSQLTGIEYFHHKTMTCDRFFAIDDFQECPELNTTLLFQVHQIRSGLSVPIITAAGDRLGAISILDFRPHQFSERDLDLLQLVSRWLASEFERKFLSQAQLNHWISDLQHPDRHEHRDRLQNPAIEPVLTAKKLSSKQDLHLTSPQIKSEIQFKLLTYLAQELRTPLTSILGMASVLQQEIYGSLSCKQKDYLGIIHHSGQQLVAIVDEIAQLGGFDRESVTDPQQHQLTLKSIDLELLCQLTIQNLEPLAQEKQQRIVLDLTKGNRLWLLDKDKIRQIIYYLTLGVIQGSSTCYQISIELANFTDRLQLQITTNDPHPTLFDPLASEKRKSASTSRQSILKGTNNTETGQDLRVSLGLSLSCTLAVLHGGKIELTTNRRGYQLSLPMM